MGAMTVGKVSAEVVVNGQVVDCPVIPVSNPARLGEVVGEMSVADTATVERAVAAASAALPGWAALSAQDRSDRLTRAAQRIGGRRDELAELLTREHGKPLAQADAHLRSAEGVLTYYAGLADLVDEERVVEDHRGVVIERRRPMGVTAVIVPWNYPSVLAMLMVAPALMAGNTVVLKLPDHSPLTLAQVLGELLDVVPAGVLNVVAGGSEEVGAPLAGHPAVRKVMFTGSTATGRHIMRSASETLKSLSLELGGNDAAIVLDDADLDDGMVDELVRGCFTASGQVCYAPKRLYVHHAIHDAFVERFVAAADRIVVGDGLDPAVTMGPVNNANQYATVRQYIELSRAEGTLRELGQYAPGTDPGAGFFLRPTIVTGLGQDAALVREEQFGPVVPILPFRDDDEAVRLANDSEYGLAASVWSQDQTRAFAVARRIEAGTVFVNVHRVGASDVSMPFGGVKQSGLGRGHGVVALEECSELQILAEREDMRQRR